ncbi:hypothetical protein CQW23_03526 [Capsicum baccatum]|uniref:NOSIC domain-containing protein n=1 Tax=Capsicum baccatum TaxID=33114 RepID=A0A2G2XC38_CAPBA|nr:hypothetical protein CQW23_03526 [Capsicum baccatum]
MDELDELDDNTIDVHENMEKDGYGKLAFNHHDEYDLDNVLMLQKSCHYIDIMHKVEDALFFANKGDVLLEEDDLEYKLIVHCNALSIDTEDEIDIIHNFIRNKYRLKFFELDSLVNYPIDYGRVIKRTDNEMDLTLVDLQGLLTSIIIMIVTVTTSTINGKPLSGHILERTLEACYKILDLNSLNMTVLDFVGSLIKYIALNLCGVVGSAVSMKLMCCAGGLMYWRICLLMLSYLLVQ